MLMDQLRTAVDQILLRIPLAKGKGEEVTKQSLVLPMINALGFDIWNPMEVCPEYDADFAIKKLGQKEKVDLAILLDNAPRIYMEVKAVDVPLDGHEGQIARYFNATPSVSLAILTNGMEYRFFTDTGDPNIMDPSPFHVVKLDAVDQGLEIMGRFHKSVFSPDAIRDFATQLNYTARISTFLRSQLDLGERDPSEPFVRWVLGEEKSYSARLTASVVERFQPIIKDALQIVLRDIVRRSVAALDKEVTSPSTQPVAAPSSVPPPSADEPKEAEEEVSTAPQEDRGRISTTDNELDLFALTRTIFEASEFAQANIRDPSTRKMVPVNLTYKDTTGYFSIYLNKPSYWVIRAVTESKTPWIGFNLTAEAGDALIPAEFKKLAPHPYAEFRLGINSVQDLKALSRLVLATLRKAIEDRERGGEDQGQQEEDHS